MKIALADEDAEIEPVPTDARRPQARAGAGPPEQHPQDVQRAVRHAVHRRRPRREAHPRRHRAQGRRRRGLPEREGEHAAHRAHGARPGAGEGDAAPLEGRHAGLQAVRRERVVQALRRRHGVCAHERVMWVSGATLANAWMLESGGYWHGRPDVGILNQSDHWAESRVFGRKSAVRYLRPEPIKPSRKTAR